ncbi:BON1-associated protein 2 [Abrus precatorius]|uniref:BON1-associated protein 2 n=1 Tax=Abrus precatorius TaxID=3816 RepID=A0A8B8LC80_ABRPR|nr:BON1-associated protein 2 [Abrus precatorius]
MPTPAKTQRVLEINLISAQGLKSPSSPRRSLQTYAVTWIDSSTKLRTRVDKVGGQNPTWNDKFLFRVTPEFLASETSGICVSIYAVGTFCDHLVGTVRFLVSNILSSEPDDARTPCFSAFQIRRSSGRFYGVMNIGAMVIDGSGFPALEKISAIGYRDLMGEKIQQRRKKRAQEKSKEEEGWSESCENSCTDSMEEGEGESSTSSSSSPRTTALKDWNGVRELAGNKRLTLTASGFLCCLVAQRSVSMER